MSQELPTTYRLYGAEISYFTGKVRAYMRWKRLAYEEVPANADVYRELIVPRVGFAVIPVVVTASDETLQDSTEIIDLLEQRHPEPTIVAPTPTLRLIGQLLELYADEWLVIPAMHYRWHHNRDWAMRSFGALSAPSASAEEQLAIGTRRAAPFAKAAVALGAEPHMHAAIEASYTGFLAELDAHFARYPYVLGSRPSIGDFGLFGPLYAHQYRDPISGEHMRRLAPHVVRWVERMLSGDADGGGEFVTECPESLAPVLRRMLREQLPVLADSAQELRAWLKDHSGERVPRVIGTHAFTLEGVCGQRMIRPYSLWMLQRARDTYLSLSESDRTHADMLLASLGGAAFMSFVDPPRLARDGMSVRLE